MPTSVRASSYTSFRRCGPLCLAAALAAPSCAGTPWPDEPGLPVTLSRADNAQTGEAFLAALTARRQAAHLPAPLVSQELQSDLVKIADGLQAGRLSAVAARREARVWGRQAYGHEVETWVLDCGAGDKMPLPSDLTGRSTLVVCYAAARFHPRSAAADQCAMVVVSPSGRDQIRNEM